MCECVSKCVQCVCVCVCVSVWVCVCGCVCVCVCVHVPPIQSRGCRLPPHGRTVTLRRDIKTGEYILLVSTFTMETGLLSSLTLAILHIQMYMYMALYMYMYCIYKCTLTLYMYIVHRKSHVCSIFPTWVIM